jgi:hypothetical protein
MNRIILFAMLISTVNVVAQPTISWTDPISVSSVSFGDKKNSIALNSSGEPMVLHGATSGVPGLYLSIMSEGEFGEPIQITPETSIYLSEAEGPIMDVFGEKIAVSYQIAGDWETGSRVVLSEDGGLTWSAPYELNPEATEYTLVESVSFDSDGLPFVGLKWGEIHTIQGIQLFDEATDSFLPPVDGGWAMDGETVCECCPSNTTSNNGIYYNIIRNNNSNTRDMWLSVSQDGYNWSDALDIDPTDWYINSCPATGASSAIMDDGTMIAVYMSGVNGSRLFWSKIELSTLELVASEQLDPANSNTENMPSVTSNGDWLITAWERNSSGYDVIVALSDAGPDALQNSVVDVTNDLEILSGHNRNPSVVFDGEHVHLTFRNTGEGVVKYMRGTISGTSKTDIIETFPWSLLTVNEGWVVSGIEGEANYILYDINGRILEEGKAYNEVVIQKRSGVSLLRVTREGHTRTFKLF